MRSLLSHYFQWRTSLAILLVSIVLLVGPHQEIQAQVVSTVGSPVQLTTRTTSQIDPSISGDLVVYTDYSAGDADIYVFDILTNTERVVASGTAMQELQDVSGSLIVYTEQSLATGVSNVMAYDYDLDAYASVTSSNTITAARPRIDGLLIAYQSFGTNYDINVSDLVTGSQITVAYTADDETMPSISGTRVVFQRHHISGWDTVMHDLATGLETVIAADGVVQPVPDINGNIVAWIGSTSAGDSVIYTYNVVTGERRQLVLTGDQSRPRVSGEFVVFDDFSGSELEVMLWQLHGDPSAPVVHQISEVGSVGFLSDIDGNRIVYTSDASGNFDTWMVEFTVDNPPVANAGPNQSVTVGGTVTLDGTGSYDDVTPSENLDYSWSFGLTPNDVYAAIVGSDTATPEVTAGVPGDYELILIVTDEVGLSSEPDTMIVSTVNAPPNADAGPDQGVIVGELVTLDGSGSNDPDGDPITNAWATTSQPVGSIVLLAGANSASPSFTPDQPGAYTVQLVVNDGTVDSAADEVTISVITNEVTAETNTTDALNIVSGLPPGDVTTRGNQQALIQALLKALGSLQDGDIDAARKKLEQAIERTDGCVLRGSHDLGGGGGGNPPAKDYITDCAVQNVVYHLLTDSLNLLVP